MRKNLKKLDSGNSEQIQKSGGRHDIKHHGLGSELFIEISLKPYNIFKNCKEHLNKHVLLQLWTTFGQILFR